MIQDDCMNRMRCSKQIYSPEHHYIQFIFNPFMLCSTCLFVLLHSFDQQVRINICPHLLDQTVLSKSDNPAIPHIVGHAVVALGINCLHLHSGPITVPTTNYIDSPQPQWSAKHFLVQDLKSSIEKCLLRIVFPAHRRVAYDPPVNIVRDLIKKVLLRVWRGEPPEEVGDCFGSWRHLWLRGLNGFGFLR